MRQTKIQVLTKPVIKIIQDETILEKLKSKGFLYISSVKVFNENSIIDVNILGGKAFIEDIWLDFKKEINIIFKDLPGIFEYKDFALLQNELKNKFENKDAVFVSFNEN